MKALTVYIDNRIEKIGALLKKPASGYTTEDFHRLRVELKKADAVFRLLGHCRKKFKRKKSFAKLKSLFDAAGEVRELQLLVKWLRRNYPEIPLNKFRKWIEANKQTQKKIFFGHCEKKGLDLKKEFAAVREAARSIECKEVGKYLALVSSKISRSAAGMVADSEKLHLFRKHLKTFRYLTKMQSKAPGHATSIHSQKTADKLGEWHDWQTHAKILGGMAGCDQLPDAERKILRTIAKKSKKRADALGGILAAELRETAKKGQSNP